MFSLPGLIFCFVLAGTCLSVGGNTDAVGSSVHPFLRCPGKCEEEIYCNAILNGTECAADGLICCLDQQGTIDSTTLADLSFTTEPYSSPEFEDNSSEEAESEASQRGEPEETEDGYTYVYSEDSEDFIVGLPEERSGEMFEERCPGSCLPSEDLDDCHFVTAGNLCEEHLTCCLTLDDVERTKHLFRYDVDEPRIVKRQSEFPNSAACPGACVPPSYSMFCEEILPEFACSMNAKCCVKSSIDRVMSGSSMECLGQCLPPNMHAFCFAPNELIPGPTSCTQGTTCCMVRSSDSFVRPSSVAGIQIPGLPLRDHTLDSSQMVLGHLAIDDMGTVFKVGTSGQISQLPRLSHMDHTRAKYTRLTSYPRVDGEIVIYSDASGHLYQQFYSRQSALWESQRPKTPLIRQPIHQFESQASQHAASFQNSAEPHENAPGDGVLEDVVIPDDDDEAPVPTTSAPVSQEDKSSNPQCPGSCMSYFLRFTCFRGYAIYDGFTCPGRSVCCARLKDIEDHEQYLKSLSPYFNVPPASRDDKLHRCGIKGTRDAPRVIGGKESLPGEWCWQVAIINLQNQYICGGALIDDSWVLTAAHCVIGPMNENQALFVRVGVTDLKSIEDNNKGQTVRVLSTFTHHNFNNVNLDNNIALLRLQKPVELGSNVCVICLPTQGKMPKENTRCTLTGYGFVSEEGDMSLIIREAQVPIIDDMDCMTNVSEALTNPFILPSSSFCAGGNGQQDACQGDAGGPLACEVGGYYELVGLVSWGLGCGRNDVPSIYIKVPAFMGWINQIISSSSFLTSLT